MARKPKKSRASILKGQAEPLPARLYLLLAAAADRGVSLPINHANTAETYARRVAMADDSDEPLRYIGTPARYNTARLLPHLAAALALIVYGAAVSLWAAGPGPQALVVAMPILTAGALAALTLRIRQVADSHTHRVFTLTDSVLCSEGPADGIYLTVPNIETLVVHTHHDATATITVAARYSPRNATSRHQMRRMDHHEAHALMAAIAQATNHTVDVYFDIHPQTAATAKPTPHPPPDKKGST